MEDPRLKSSAEVYSSFALPSIRVRDSNAHNGHQLASTRPMIPTACQSIGPMSIPNSKASPPPALPPPKYIDEDDFGWYHANKHLMVKNPSLSVSSYARISGDPPPRRRGHAGDDGSGDRVKMETDLGREISIAAIERSPSMDEIGNANVRHSDEGYASLSVRSGLSQKLQGEESQRNAFLQRSTQAYDNSLLQRFDAARSEYSSRHHNHPPRTLKPSSFRGEASSMSQLKPLALSVGSASPDIRHLQRLRLASVPDLAVSPRHTSFDLNAQSYSEYRETRREIGSICSNATEADGLFSGFDMHPVRSQSLSIASPFENGSSFASRSARGSYAQGMHHEHEEETGIRYLHLGERTPPRRGRYSPPESKAGQKRRASSPPRDLDSPITWNHVGNGADLFARRSSAHPSAERKPSVPRLYSGSVSSASSGQRAPSSLPSGGLSLTASSATSMSSFDRLSPRGTSPTSEMDAHDSPHTASSSLHPSPRGSISRGQAVKTNSIARRSPGDEEICPMTKPRGAGKMQNVFICECCPKKPKKFDNPQDLETHRREKQYTCQYCHNRFKNKNEAERHQNSLHLRRHSWSCNALTGVEAAFHPSPQKPCLIDICGYCGKEFPTPANIDARAEHLATVHKFGECNHSKKFFRADHFRQHLKHSHAGLSGKWTNMLETACMKDEPLPERINSVSDGVGRISEEREV